MPRTKPFRAVRPLKSFDSAAAIPFDPRQKVFVPDLSIGDDQIESVDVRKVQFYAAKVYSAAAITLADGVAEDLVFDTTEYDQGGFFDGSTTFTVPFTGLYTVGAYVAFDGDVDGIRTLRLYLNGTAHVTDIRLPVGTATETPLLMSVPLRLEAGDTLKLNATQNAGANLDIRGGVEDNYFSIIYMGEI